MKLILEVPKGFEACGITIIYDGDVRGQAIYSTSITRDEVAGEKVLVLPMREEE